jgi:hypothetical protein
MASHHIGSEPLPYSHSFRVEITVDADGVTVTDVRRVAMRAPTSAPDSPVEGQAGMWFELRDDDGRLLYHRALRTLHPDSVEVFDEQTGSIRRVPTDRQQAKFDLIVPDLADASHLDLYGARSTAEKYQPSVRTLRVEMPELRRGGAGRPGR